MTVPTPPPQPHVHLDLNVELLGKTVAEAKDILEMLCATIRVVERDGCPMVISGGWVLTRWNVGIDGPMDTGIIVKVHGRG